MLAVQTRNPGPAALRAIKVLVFLLCSLPFLMLVLATFGIAGLSLGANPVESLIHQTGLWGLRFLLITLAVTPIHRLSGLTWLVRLRRMLGLFAFFYVLTHFLSYALIDQRLALGPIVEDIIERPFITLGVLGLLMLLPLALTSTNAMMRRLGRRWKQLHRMIYVIAIIGVWHFWWQVKQDILEPLIYAGILALLLGFRLWDRWWRTARQRRRAKTWPAPAFTGPDSGPPSA
jgi:sulfoxide reductase heme-binding subunit YedZ